MCPSYLDGDQIKQLIRCYPLIQINVIGYCAVLKVREGLKPSEGATVDALIRVGLSQPSRMHLLDSRYVNP